MKHKRRKRHKPGSRKATRAQHPLERNCQSPIEVRLLRALVEALPPGARLRVQVPIGCYFADFAIECGQSRYVVEADGKAWHTSPEQREYDARRDAFMRGKGWTVVRFTGSEIARDSRQCAQLVADTINGVVCRVAEVKARQAERKAAARKVRRAAREERVAAYVLGGFPVRSLPEPTKPDAGPARNVATLAIW